MITTSQGNSHPTVVLVHGAFAESASWNGVLERLLPEGFPVIAAAIPIRSLAEDASLIASIVRSIRGPVVLVGHSYGGAVITNAARDVNNVRALVYVAGFAPDAGESIAELAGRFPGSTLADAVEPVPLADGTVDLYIRQERFHQQFCADVPEAQATLMAVTQRPLRDVALNDRSGEPAWRTIPSWFLIPELDQNIPAALQRFMAARADARAIVSLDGASHAAAVSHPAEAAGLIRNAVEAIAGVSEAQPSLH